VTPGPRHPDILTDIMGAASVSGNLTTDAHLAALAIEVQGEVHSNDNDFTRFPGLRWRNPLDPR
jgi:predicted nucleic acid-binding protein